MPLAKFASFSLGGSALLWLGAVLSAAPLPSLSTRSCTLVGSNGVVVALRNRLCGETLVVPTGDKARLSALRRLAQSDLRVETATRCRLTNSATGLGWEASWDEPGDGEAGRWQARMECDPATGDILVQQSGRLATNGLVGVSWGIASVPDTVEVLVPGCSGQRFGADAPAQRRTFDYPFTWEAAFVLIQGRRGGVIVWADDTRHRFKSLVLDHSRRAFRLRFESQNLAPFENQLSVVSSRWRIRAYAGNWQTGAAIYRQWAKARFDLVPLEERGPAWASRIRFVVTMNLDQSLLSALATRCNPAQTLLYLPGWRKDGYDRNYPDYTASSALTPFVTEAHRLGFRVMLHVNYFGCDPKNPLYEIFKPWQMRDPFSGEPQWWEWPAQPPIKFAYIDPASQAWRKTLTQRLADAAKQYSADALHLDQTLCIYNDKNGRIDGLNCIEGSLALHRELRAALPEVALSGEGLNEITSQYEHFAQRHIWSMDHVHHTWDDRQVAMSHPISSAVLGSYTQIYGYLGMPNPADAATFTVWRQAYERWGVLPTYCWPQKSQLDAPPPPVAALLEQAQFFQANQARPDFETPWGGRDLFRYRLKDGGQAAFVQDQGVAFETRLAGQKPRVRQRRLEGVAEARVPGSIPGWLAFDAKKIIGLNPEQGYAWSARPRDLSVPHLSSLPPGFRLGRSGVQKGFARFQIIRSPADEAKHTIALWDYAGFVTGGVRLADGGVRILGGLEFADDETAGTVHPDGDGLFAHPPWKRVSPQPGDHQNISFVEFPLKLPESPKVFFRGGVQLKPGAEGKSDGVTFKVSAACGGQELSRDIHHDREQTQALELDLSAWRGRSVLLRLEVGPGPAGSVAYDWGRFVRPQIVAPQTATPLLKTVRFAGFAAPDAVLAACGNVRLILSKAGRSPRPEVQAQCTLPNTLILPTAPPAAVTLPCDLLQRPFSSHVVFGDGIERAGDGYPGGAILDVKCRTEPRRSLSLPSVPAGKFLADWWLKLPAAPARLLTAVGIPDGPAANGTRLLIEASGRPVFERVVQPGSGWLPIEISLAEWKGQPLALTFLTESSGESRPGHMAWAEPRLVPELP